jgi:hypothetical protein
MALARSFDDSYIYCPNSYYILINNDEYDHCFDVTTERIKLSLFNTSSKQSHTFYLIDDKWYDKDQSIIIGDVNTTISDLIQFSQILDLFK